MDHDADRIPTVAGHSRYAPLALRALTNEALIRGIEALVAQERESTVDVIEHLMEFDRRELAADLAYPSLFTYCIKKLGYSEAAAFARIRAARAAADFPQVLDRLRAGTLHLEAIVRLYPYLDKQNNTKLLNQASGASKREVLSLVAMLQTEPGPAKDVILPVAPAAATPPLGSPCVQEKPVPQIIPPLLHRFHFTADDELLRMVEDLRGLLRHKIPDGRLEAIFKEALKVLRERILVERTPKQAQRDPLGGKVARAGRLVPKKLKRLVWARDEGRCTYTASDGRRCESRDALEYDHIIPWAEGGRSDTVDNIRLLCRAHNQRLARKRFGPRRRRKAALSG